MRNTNKISLDSDIKNNHIPNKTLNTAFHIKKFGLWNSSFIKDQEVKEYIHSREENLDQYKEITPTEMDVKDYISLVDEFHILHTLIH